MGTEHLELFNLELEKIAEPAFVYTLTSTNINQPTPNLVEMYVTTRCWMSFTMDPIETERLKVIRKTAIIDFIYTLASANIDQSAKNMYDQQITNKFDYKST